MIKDRKSKNILIGGLLIAVLIMVVAYASLATNLQINGTANVSSTWNVQIFSVTPDKTATNSGTAQAPNYTTPGDISHSITGNNLTANFDAALISPGDIVVYTIVVKNNGTIDAVLTSTTKTNSNNSAITFGVNGLIDGETLAAGASKTFTVVVGYASNTTSQPNNTTGTMGITLNYAQAGTVVSSSKVYAINTNDIVIGTSTLSNVGTTYSSCVATGKNMCLRHTITNNIVTASEACFIKGGIEYCLTGGDNGASYNTNISILQSAFTENNACHDYGSNFECGASGLDAAAGGGGVVSANDGSWTCYVRDDGYSYCYGAGGGGPK